MATLESATQANVLVARRKRDVSESPCPPAVLGLRQEGTWVTLEPINAGEKPSGKQGEWHSCSHQGRRPKEEEQ